MPVNWIGLDEYEAALANWPADTAREAATIVHARAARAYDTIRAAYPVVTGRLRDGLRVLDATRDPLTPHWTVRNDVAYARVFESGGAAGGHVQAPGKTFVPTSMRERRAMVDETIEIVKASGAVAVIRG